MTTEITVVRNEADFNKFAPSLYNTVLKDVGLVFYPRRDLLIVDLRGETAKYIAPYNNGILNYEYDKIATLVEKVRERSKLFIIDMKNIRAVLDIENDRKLNWFTEPASDANEAIVFSGDGTRHLLYSVYSSTKMSIHGINVVSRFNSEITTIAGMNFLLGYFDILMDSEQSYTVKEAIRAFPYSIEDVDQNYCNTYDVRRLKKVLANKPKEKQPLLPAVSPPATTSLATTTPAPEATSQTEKIYLSAIKGDSEFPKEGYVTLDLETPLDINWINISDGRVLVCRTLSGSTSITDLSEMFNWPISKVMMVFNTLNERSKDVSS